MGGEVREFRGVIREEPGGRAHIEVPFDPDEAWGVKERHHVAGSIDGVRVRGPLVRAGAGWRFALGPAWRRDSGVRPGDEVTVILAPEGPQRDSLAPDLAAALDAEPEAAAFWDALATFYRKGYLRWLDGAARRPALREDRVRQWIALLKAGKKSRD